MHSHSANICIKIVQLSGDSAPGDCSVVLQWERAPAQANHCFGRRRWGAMSWECGQQTWLQGKRGSPEEPRAEGAGGKNQLLKKQIGCPWRRLQGETWICTQLLRMLQPQLLLRVSENPREYFLSNKEYYKKKPASLSLCVSLQTHKLFLFIRLSVSFFWSWGEVFFEVHVGTLCNPLPSAVCAAATLLGKPVLVI